MAMRLPEAILGALCACLALLPIFQPFFLGTVPSAEACWIATPSPGPGLFGYGPLENDGNFVSLYLLYSLANAISCAGFYLSCRMWIKLRREGDYRSKRYHQYLRSLIAYFVFQMLINFTIATAFVDNRCGYHNVDQRGTCNVWSEYSSQPSPALVSYLRESAGVNCSVPGTARGACSSDGGDCCASMRWGEPPTCRGGLQPLTLSDLDCEGHAPARSWTLGGLYACCDVGGDVGGENSTLSTGCDDTKCTYNCNSSLRTCVAGYQAVSLSRDEYTCCPFTTSYVEPPMPNVLNPASVYVGRIAYLFLTFLGGILTNVMLELVLVRKAHMVEGVGTVRGCKCFMRSVSCLIVFQLVILVLLMIGSMTAYLAVLCLSLASEEGEETEPSTGAIRSMNLVTVPLGTFTLAHMYVSIGICVVFVRLLKGLKRQDKREALSTAPLGGLSDGVQPVALSPMEREGQSTRERTKGDLQRTRVMRRVTYSTIVSISSTLFSYGTLIGTLILWENPLNFIIFLALDSIINDACLLYVALKSEEDDAANAQEAEMQSFGSRLGFVDAGMTSATGSAGAITQQPQRPGTNRV